MAGCVLTGGGDQGGGRRVVDVRRAVLQPVQQPEHVAHLVLVVAADRVDVVPVWPDRGRKPDGKPHGRTIFITSARNK